MVVFYFFFSFLLFFFSSSLLPSFSLSLSFLIPPPEYTIFDLGDAPSRIWGIENLTKPLLKRLIFYLANNNNNNDNENNNNKKVGEGGEVEVMFSYTLGQIRKYLGGFGRFLQPLLSEVW